MADENEENQPPVEEDNSTPPPDGFPLSKELVSENLAMLAKSREYGCYAFIHANLHNKQLRVCDVIAEFPHLQKVDLSQNKLTDLQPLKSLPDLLTVNLAQNKLSEAVLTQFDFLQVADLHDNEIESVQLDNVPRLNRLVLTKNKISALDGMKSAHSLTIVELRDNLINDLGSIASSFVTELWMANNQVTSLSAINQFPALKKLHLRGNKITSLADLPQLEANGKFESGTGCVLEKLNLRGNQIEEPKQLQYLRCMPVLNNLNVLESPLAESENFRIETIIILPNLLVLNKERITLEERNEAKAVIKQRKEEEEEAARVAAEEAAEAARIAAEEAAAAAEAEGGEEEADE